MCHLHVLSVLLILGSWEAEASPRPRSLREWCKGVRSQEGSPSSGTADEPLISCPTNDTEASWLLPEPNLAAGTAHLGMLSQSRLRAAMHRFLVEKKNLTVGFIGQLAVGCIRLICMF